MNLLPAWLVIPILQGYWSVVSSFVEETTAASELPKFVVGKARQGRITKAVMGLVCWLASGQGADEQQSAERILQSEDVGPALNDTKTSILDRMKDPTGAHPVDWPAVRGAFAMIPAATIGVDPSALLQYLLDAWNRRSGWQPVAERPWTFVGHQLDLNEDGWTEWAEHASSCPAIGTKVKDLLPSDDENTPSTRISVVLGTALLGYQELLSGNARNSGPILGYAWHRFAGLLLSLKSSLDRNVSGKPDGAVLNECVSQCGWDSSDANELLLSLGKYIYWENVDVATVLKGIKEAVLSGATVEFADDLFTETTLLKSLEQLLNWEPG